MPSVGLNFRSESTLPMLMMLMFISVFFATKVVFATNEVMQDVIAGAMIPAILVIMAVTQITARLTGQSHDHMTFTYRLPTNGEPITRDVYLESPEPMSNIKPVVPLLVKNGKEYPIKLIERFWFPYKVLTRPVTISFFGSCSQHIWFLPAPWHDFFKTYRRIDAAYLNGENYTHSHSEATTSYLLPIQQEFLGVYTPMFLFVEASKTWEEVTKGWVEDMMLLSRTNMQRFIQDHSDELWPAVQPEQTLERIIERFNEKEE